MGDDNMQNQENRDILRENIATRGFRVPQVVILFMTFEAMEDSITKERMKQQVEELREFGYKPIVVFSKADEGEYEEYCQRIREDPHKLFQIVPYKQKEMYVMLNELGVSHNDGFYMVSYKDEQTRTFGIDKLTYVVLLAALRRAKEFIDMEEKTQHPIHKCGDYTSGTIVPRRERRADRRHAAFVNFMGSGDVVDNGTSTSRNGLPNPQNDNSNMTHSSSTNGTPGCFICPERRPTADVLFVNFKEDCGHQCLCNDCLRDYKVGDKCPVCNVKIDKIVTIKTHRF